MNAASAQVVADDNGAARLNFSLFCAYESMIPHGSKKEPGPVSNTGTNLVNWFNLITTWINYMLFRGRHESTS